LGSRSRSACNFILASFLLLAASARAEHASSWTPLSHLYGGASLASTDGNGTGDAASTPAAVASETLARSARESAQEGVSAPAESRSIPSRGTALLLSLALPGAGELKLGAKGRATGFFITEGAIWTHFAWFTVAGNLRKDDYIEQAQLNAGVGIDSADDEYWRLVGAYERSSGSGAEAYEEELRREARDLYPTDPAAQDAWVAERLPSGGSAWTWTDPALRQSYRDTRERSRRAFDRAKYSFAAAILNRIVSVIDTQMLHRKLSREARGASEGGSGGSLRLSADASPNGSGRLVLSRTF